MFPVVQFPVRFFYKFNSVRKRLNLREKILQWKANRKLSSTLSLSLFLSLLVDYDCCGYYSGYGLKNVFTGFDHN